MSLVHLQVGYAITKMPEGFHLHKGVKRVYDQRRQMVESGEGIDWGMAEALAFGTLLSEGDPWRLCITVCFCACDFQRSGVEAGNGRHAIGGYSHMLGFWGYPLPARTSAPKSRHPAGAL